ncbi:MAG: hypothetical protein D6730_08325 [Bacteroidetes bacterium]|nr:MAG: hypothetical protein D6730_08325 [Bacteroidota bacterium]
MFTPLPYNVHIFEQNAQFVSLKYSLFAAVGTQVAPYSQQTGIIRQQLAPFFTSIIIFPLIVEIHPLIRPPLPLKRKLLSIAHFPLPIV